MTKRARARMALRIAGVVLQFVVCMILLIAAIIQSSNGHYAQATFDLVLVLLLDRLD